MTEEAKYFELKTGINLHTIGDGKKIMEVMKSYKDEEVKKTIEEIEKSLPSDEEIEEMNWLEKDIVRDQRNKTQEVINKLQKDGK